MSAEPRGPPGTVILSSGTTYNGEFNIKDMKLINSLQQLKLALLYSSRNRQKTLMILLYVLLTIPLNGVSCRQIDLLTSFSGRRTGPHFASM